MEQDKTFVPNGTRFRPNPWEFWHGSQKFEGGRVAHLKICRVTEGQPPSRNELGDLDETLWEGGKDPWQMNSRFVAQEMHGELVTFSTLRRRPAACDHLLKATSRTETTRTYGRWSRSERPISQQ